LGIGDWGLGQSPNPPSPKPQTPNPKPQGLFVFLKKKIFILKIIKIN